ncbi:MAG: hypothetical protein Q8N77_04560 [Nanoarchaeota archaeon]|nr:hypothetical protein [Nanoarchaeota archaeon]
MKKYKIIIAIVILIASLVILVDKIFTTTPIQIVLESGQEVVTQDSSYYNLEEVILLVICAFLVGLSSIFVYYNSNEIGKEYFLRLKRDKSKEKMIANLLKEDEKKVYQEILNSNNEILQNELVRRTNLSKVKITRIVHRLKLKGLVIKERYGLTNKIKLKTLQE